ncbi:DNA-directed RNA polymerase subunit RPB5 [uncultured virus]|nr:DNA-directed RNA polymerase subunit RPB5 [uncultured virus]
MSANNINTMLNNVNLYQIEKNTEDTRKTLLANVVKMLTERKLLNKENLDDNIKNILNIINDDLIYLINIDKLINNLEKNFAIKIIFQKITAMNKSYGMSEFLVNYKKYPKIIIVKDISKKALQYVFNNFTNTEIFLEKELMINIIDHVLVPKHEILEDNDAKEVLTKYNAKKRNMPKILSSDPIARYFNMKSGQICKIIRPSEKSGLTVSYRLVIKGSIR